MYYIIDVIEKQITNVVKLIYSKEKKMVEFDQASIYGRFVEGCGVGSYYVVDYKEGENGNIIFILQDSTGKQFEFECSVS